MCFGSDGAVVGAIVDEGFDEFGCIGEFLCFILRDVELVFCGHDDVMFVSCFVVS